MKSSAQPDMWAPEISPPYSSHCQTSFCTLNSQKFFKQKAEILGMQNLLRNIEILNLQYTYNLEHNTQNENKLCRLPCVKHEYDKLEILLCIWLFCVNKPSNCLQRHSW